MSIDETRNENSKISIAMLGSIGANVLLWCGLSLGSNMPVPVPKQAELVFDRVAVDKVHKSVKPVFRPVKPIPPQPQKPKPEPTVSHLKPPPPETAHSHVIAAKDPVPTPSREKFVVQSGGKAPVGVPIDKQGTGNALSNPPAPPPPVTPPVVSSKVAAPPPPVTPPPNETKKEQPPTPPPPPPPPPPPAKPRGESREAKPDHQESVDIPESLKTQSFKSFVRVRVEIAADGKFKVILRTSSGNADVDKLVLDTLNRWTWKPALKDGDPADSVQQFRFNFSIE